MKIFRQCGRRTFRLAVGAVLVVFLSQHFGQDGLVLLVQFLGLLPLRACRHDCGFCGSCLMRRSVPKSVVNRKMFLVKDHNQRYERLRVRCENTRNRNPFSAHRNSKADGAAAPDWTRVLTSTDAQRVL